MKARYLLLVASVVLPLGVAGPAVSQDEASAVEISIPRGTPSRVVEDMSARFDKAYPKTKLDYRLGAEEWTGQLQKTLRSAVTGDLPSVSHQSLNNLRVLVARGVVAPLDTFIEEAGGWEALGYLPRLKETVTVDGSIYAVPFATTIPLVFYNMDLVKKAGYDKESLPETWDEIFALAKKVDALGDKVMGIYMEVDATSAWMFQTILMSLGGSMMNPAETQIAFDGEEGLRTLEITRELGESGQIVMSDNQARQQFMAGGVGIYIRSASVLPKFTKAAEGKFEFRAGQIPVPKPGASLPGAGNGMVMHATDPAQQRAAWRYMTFAAGASGQAALIDNTGYAPINVKAVSQPGYLKDFYEERPFYRLVVDRFPIISDWYAFPGNNSPRIFQTMIDEQLAVVAGQTTPEDALATMAKTARELLSK